MPKTTPEQNKAIVLEAFETLFNKRDYAAAERFWSPKYIQHSAHIPPGREGLFALVRATPDTLRYENHLILAEGDYVIAHGRFTGMGRPAAWIAADIIHPERILAPSASDIRSIHETFTRSKHHLNGFVLLIAGTEVFPLGMFVGLYDAHGEIAILLDRQ